MQFYSVTLTLTEGDELVARKVILQKMIELHRTLREVGVTTHLTVLDPTGDDTLKLFSRDGEESLDAKAQQRGYTNAVEALADAWRYKK
jgi:hypothetical protein